MVTFQESNPYLEMYWKQILFKNPIRIWKCIGSKLLKSYFRSNHGQYQRTSEVVFSIRGSLSEQLVTKGFIQITQYFCSYELRSLVCPGNKWAREYHFEVKVIRYSLPCHAVNGPIEFTTPLNRVRYTVGGVASPSC